MRTRRWLPSDPGGILVGFLLAALSVTPSLLPRPALLQGVVTGLSFAIGYAFGALLLALLTRYVTWRPSARARRSARWGFAGVMLAASVVVAVAALGWQNEVRRFVEMPPATGLDLTLFFVGAIPTAVLCILVGRGMRALYRMLRTRVGVSVAGISTAVLVGIGVFLLGVVAMSAIDGVYQARNAGPADEVSEPSSSYRSAGVDSALDWNDLGRHGSVFIGGGPTTAEIEAATGAEAVNPIRVYAGLASADTSKERAALAVQELERTGAFDRSVLVVATPTGSGWLEAQTVDSLEYLHGGDTAIVAAQYAYTPSWVSFVFDPDAPIESARTLFDAVYEHWATLPSTDRPQLVVYGLSLGAHGGQGSFADLADLQQRTDGALFVGSPNGSPMWRNLTAQRDAGSPIWRPVLDDGSAVRWMSTPADFEALPGQWNSPRVAYLQHATDPVTWLGPELIWAEPDWLKSGQRAADVSPSMRWIPVVTGVQVVVDMLMGESVPARHGHNYGDVVLDGWRAVTGDGGLDAVATDRIRTIIAGYAVSASSTD
ncbi:alpha/beta-hydrolase family protein [Leifsonia kafniensis]|uniref:Alpha/beta-hydrolase family protein n=1 Tax=Leifsonia kafniensis TaxID=475957 RepID=A0ABP7K213_9MICO